MRLFRTSWGKCELWCSSFDTEDGRDLVVQKFIRGGGANVQNRGDVPRVVRAELIFDDIRGQEETPDDRFVHLLGLKALGKPQLLVHPLYGSYRAEIGEFSHRIDMSGSLTATVQFVAVEDETTTPANPIGISIDAGAATIGAFADALDNELADAGIPTLGAQGLTVNQPMSLAPLSDLARHAGDVLEDSTAPLRDVLAQVESVSTQLGQAIETLQTGADLALWPVHKAIVMLADATLVASNSAQGDSSGLFTMIVNQATSLRRLCADLYGENFDAAFIDALDLNDIATPARIKSGTRLRLRQPGSF